MATINVTVYDSTENKRVPVELPDDAPCNKIIVVLIQWWYRRKLQSARVLVIGAGALGNESLKNLVLLGFERIVVVDLDKIEESNLSRTILYRSSDVGSFKADVAARSAAELAPNAKEKALVANAVPNCGLGISAWSDVIIAGLDNRQAPPWLNRCAWKMNWP